jgi:predicted Zn-dependent protease with MMP-like domain
MSIEAKWTEWLRHAEREVMAVLASLPSELQAEARKVTVAYERKPGRELIEDGLEEDTLGLFVGSAFSEGVNQAPLPQQIILYLENLWDVAEGDTGIFCEEVRATFLHELGHYLGLDEDELTERGLE